MNKQTLSQSLCKIQKQSIPTSFFCYSLNYFTVHTIIIIINLFLNAVYFILIVCVCFAFSLQTIDCNRVCLSELEFSSDFHLKITNTTDCTVSQIYTYWLLFICSLSTCYTKSPWNNIVHPQPFIRNTAWKEQGGTNRRDICQHVLIYYVPVLSLSWMFNRVSAWIGDTKLMWLCIACHTT